MRLTLFLICILVQSCGAQESARPTATGQPVGGGCDGCEWMYDGLPAHPRDVDTSAGWKEGGPLLRVTGQVFSADGRTPAAGVLIYYWQTDTQGLYARGSDTSRGAGAHGRIRGWVKTDAAGRYHIYTIRPAPYPNAAIPAHIHFSVREPGQANEYYIDDLLFEDDPLLTAAERRKQEGRGGAGIVTLKREGAISVARRDIYLGRNIPHYRR